MTAVAETLAAGSVALNLIFGGALVTGRLRTAPRSRRTTASAAADVAPAALAGPNGHKAIADEQILSLRAADGTGLSFRALAEATGIPKSTVQAHWHRARARAAS